MKGLSLLLASLLLLTSCVKGPCSNVLCLNNGTCLNGDCFCPEWFEGAYCERAVREKYVGIYRGNFSSTLGSQTTQSTIDVIVSSQGDTNASVLYTDNNLFKKIDLLSSTSSHFNYYPTKIFDTINQTLPSGINADVVYEYSVRGGIFKGDSIVIEGETKITIPSLGFTVASDYSTDYWSFNGSK